MNGTAALSPGTNRNLVCDYDINSAQKRHFLRRQLGPQHVNGLAYGSPTTSTNFSFSWSTNTAGFYTFVAVARDNDGFTNGSPPVTVILDPPGGNPPVAVMSNLVSTLVTTNFSTFTITNPPILRDGLYDLLGQARDSDSTPSYQVVLRRPGETNDFANVTPLPSDGKLNGSAVN